MKTNFYQIFILLSVCICMISCGTEDMKFKNAKVTAVETLFEPADGKVLKLSTQGSTFFSWEPARSEDSGAPLYELLFDNVGGGVISLLPFM